MGSFINEEGKEVMNAHEMAPAQGQPASDGQAAAPAVDAVLPEIQKQYQNLEKKLGEQGNELGSLRKANRAMTKQLEIFNAQQAAPQQQAPGVPAPPGYEEQVAGIYKRLEDGDLSVSEAIAQSNKLTAELVRQSAAQEADSRVNQALKARDSESVYRKFITEHPDFLELQDAGELENVKASLPGMHDDFSAYFALQAERKAQEGYEKGKTEMEQIAKGDQRTGNVLRKPGAAIRTQNQLPTGKTGDVKAAMLAGLQAVRGGGQ